VEKNEETPYKNINLDKLDHEHVYQVLTDNEVGWQAIIYDLINTEQLDPWNLDLTALAQKYLEKIRELEEADFFISSNIILAASLLLRIKSEILLDRYLPGLDEILFGKKEEAKKPAELLEIDEAELPLIYPKSPMPRMKKVTLEELMAALNKAIKTENRRIRKEISIRHARRESEVVFPRTRINIKDRIRQIYARILSKVKQKKQKIPYSHLVNGKEERVAGFLPVLYLDSQQKVFLEQDKHYEEIYVWLYKHYREENPFIEEGEETQQLSEAEEGWQTAQEIEEEEEEILKTIEGEEKINKETGFDNPLGDLLTS